MRLFVLIGGLVVLALMTALIAPHFVDWGDYRSRFEAEASRLLGQDVRVAGGASARLIPFPSVTFSDVRVGPEGQPNITIEQFSMDAELAPFLSGEILIFDMRLVSPVIRLDLDDEGKPIWKWPTQSPVDPAQVSLENATFTDATLVLRDPKDNRQWDFLALNGSAAAQSLFGPWRVNAEGLLRGTPFSGRLTTGSLSRQGFAARINAVLPVQNLEVVTEGRIAPPTSETTRWYSGQFSIKPSKSDAPAYEAQGVFEADARSFVVDEFQADFGDPEDPYTVSGRAAIVGGAEPRFDFVANGNQVNVEQIDGNGEPVALGTRLQAIGNVLDSIPLPNVPGKIELDLPAIVFGPTTIRDVKLAARPSGDKWKVDGLSAKLPGRTIIEADGLLALGSSPRFDGKMVVASRQPSGLANWLTGDVSEAIRLLPNAGFSADVSLTETAQNFENFEAIFGDAALQGDLYRQSDKGSLPKFGLSLRGDNTDLDTLRALGTSIFGNDGSFRLADHDVDVSLDLNQSIIAGVPVGGIDASMRIRGERTEIDRLALTDVYGSSFSATGTVVRSQDDKHSINFDTSLIAPEGSVLISNLASRFDGQPMLSILEQTASRSPNAFSDTVLNVVGALDWPVDGPIEGSASVSGQTGGSEILFTTTMQTGGRESDEFIGSLVGTIENPEAAVLLSQAGFDILPIRLLGEGALNINLAGGVKEGLSARLELVTPDSQISSDGMFTLEQGALSYAGAGNIVSADAEPLADLFGYFFPATGLGTPMKAGATIRYSDDSILLSNLIGDVAGNSFAGTARINKAAEGAKIEGALNVDAIDPGFVANVLTGRYDLGDNAALFNKPLFADHSLDLQLRIGNFGSARLPITDVQTRLVYRDGALSLRGFEGTSGEGSLRGEFEAQNNDGTMLINGQFNAQDILLSALLAQSETAPDVTGDLAVTVAGSGKSKTGLIGALTGAGTISVDQIEITDLNENAIAPLLKAADQIGYQISDLQIEEIAKAAVLNGKTVLPTLTVPVSVANGALTASNVSVELESADIAADLVYQLADQSLSANGRIVFEPGDEAVAGARPEIGWRLETGIADGTMKVSRDYTLLAAFVRQRALEIEQARVEALQARLLEKQRFRREVRYLKFVESERLAAIEAARLAKLEAERLAKLAAERRAQEAAARRKEAERLAEEKRLAEEARLEQERQRAEEQRRLDAERAAEQQRLAEAEAARAREQDAAQPDQRPDETNKTDNRLLDDPLAPIAPRQNIFEDLNFGLGN